MRTLFFVFFTLLFISTNAAICQTPMDSVVDIDGNIYHTVKIGKQVWMVENLKVTKYRNGDPIPFVTDTTKWEYLINGAYFNYKNDKNFAKTFGNLYNWYAVNDDRNITPVGWHIPTNSEWMELINYLGGEDVAGGKMKDNHTLLWKTPNIGATNESGFTALPGGTMYENHTFGFLSERGYWWSYSEIDHDVASYITMAWHNSIVGILDEGTKKAGLSVRCIKD